MAGITPVQRTLAALRQQGRICAIVERFNQYASPYGVRQDLFNIIDIIALDPERGLVGIQACGMDFAAHWRKLTIEHAQETTDWLSTPSVHGGLILELWGWRKVKLHRGGKAERWQPRVKAVTLDDVGFERRVQEIASEEAAI